MADEPVERFPEGPSDDEIAERLRRVRQELHEMEGLPDLSEEELPRLSPLPPTPDFEDRFRELDERAQLIKDRRDAAIKTEKRAQAKDAESSKGLGIGLTVAYAIIGVPLFGIFVGWLVDQQSHTTVYRGLGALIGSIAGIVGAVMILNRSQNSGK